MPQPKSDYQLKTREEVLERIESIRKNREKLSQWRGENPEKLLAYNARQDKLARLNTREAALTERLKSMEVQAA